MNLAPCRRHRESVIVLLPKEGKDTKDIKNWKPITLSNWVAKIINKAPIIRMSSILDEIIDPNQNAYGKGRAVADNLRSIVKSYNIQYDGQMININLILEVKIFGRYCNDLELKYKRNIIFSCNAVAGKVLG